MSRWWSKNNVTLNNVKAKHLIMFSGDTDGSTPHIINGEQVKCVSFFRFLGNHSTTYLMWTRNTITMIKKSPAAGALPHILRNSNMRKSNMDQKLLLVHVESVFSYCLGLVSSDHS